MNLAARLLVLAAIGGALLAAVLGYGKQQRIEGRAEIQAKWDADKLVRSAKALETIKEYRDEESRRMAVLRDQAAAFQAQADRARRDAAAGAAERDGLRDYAAALAAACDRPARDPAAAAGSPSGAAPGLVLSNLLGRADDVAQELALQLDLAHAAGRACERIHDQLSGARP